MWLTAHDKDAFLCEAHWVRPARRSLIRDILVWIIVQVLAWAEIWLGVNLRQVWESKV